MRVLLFGEWWQGLGSLPLVTFVEIVQVFDSRGFAETREVLPESVQVNSSVVARERGSEQERGRCGFTRARAHAGHNRLPMLATWQRRVGMCVACVHVYGLTVSESLRSSRCHPLEASPRAL